MHAHLSFPAPWGFSMAPQCFSAHLENPWTRVFPKGLQDRTGVRKERPTALLSDCPPQSSFCFLSAPYLSSHPYL